MLRTLNVDFLEGFDGAAVASWHPQRNSCVFFAVRVTICRIPADVCKIHKYEAGGKSVRRRKQWRITNGWSVHCGERLRNAVANGTEVSGIRSAVLAPVRIRFKMRLTVPAMHSD